MKMNLVNEGREQGCSDGFFEVRMDRREAVGLCNIARFRIGGAS